MVPADARRELAQRDRELAFVKAFWRLHMGPACPYVERRAAPITRHACPLFGTLTHLLIRRSFLSGKV